MALFQWSSTTELCELQRCLQDASESLGLEVDQELSQNASIYVREKGGSAIPLNSRVTVLISPRNGARTEFLVEVRSSEPMLRRGTRCEDIASKLKALIPAKP